MVNSLDSIWIIDSNSGICLLHRVFNEDKDFGDETMFSGFITAILNFVSSTAQEAIESIVLGGFDIHIKSFTTIIVVISTKKNSTLKNLDDLMNKVGTEFVKAFHEKLTGNLFSVQDFENFGDTIESIFGAKTIQIIPEHEALIDLIKNSEKVNIPEELATESIILFFKNLPDYKRKIITESMYRILMSTVKDPSKVALLTNISTDVTEEFSAFKLLLKKAQQNNLEEDGLIKEIVLFFGKVTDAKKVSLMNKTKGTIEIHKPSKKLDKDTKKKFENLLKLV